MLPIAPATYYARKARQADPTRVSARGQRDAQLRPEVARVWRTNRRVYGAKKVWKQLRREGHVVARCTVARLMRAEGLRGVVRGRRVRTTIPDALADRPQDLVQRQLTATRPNQLWVSDFTYVATWRGVVYVAFVTDVFARRIVGWRAGSNVACPTIRTTNDMPIVEPPGLGALGLVRIQVNAHYTEARLGDHGGETRVDRLNEFVHANPGMPVVGLPEGTALRLEGGKLSLLGEEEAVVYGLTGGPRRVDAGGFKELGLR